MTPSPRKTLYLPRLWRGVLTGLALVGIAIAVGVLPAVRFTWEQIDIHVGSDQVTVEGTYVYENPWPFPVAQGFSIPLPVDEEHPEPVEVTASLSGRPIPLRYILGSHRFQLAFAPGEVARVRVRYRQRAPGRDARYILKTTQPWGRPLSEGIYRLILDGVRLRSSNYPLANEDTANDSSGQPSSVLGFRRLGFMPSSDWRFAWEPTS